MIGSEDFRQELLGRMQERVGLSHYGAELGESDEQKAKRIIAEEIRGLKFSAINFGELSKGDVRKVKIARRLRQETAVPLRWIADQLEMGSVPYLAHLIKKG